MELQQQEKLDLWRERIQDRKNSGLTIIEWCDQNGFSKHAYYYWNKRVKMNIRKDTDAPVFIEIPRSVPDSDPLQEPVREKNQPDKKSPSLCILYNGVRITCGTAQEAQLAAEFIGRLQKLCSKHS